ncbi:AAA family ATPase [bacterium]|nr:AAA family ATPase [bacterium]
MKKVLYWAFEGNEGTGKSTLSQKFADRCNATWTYEPNGETEELKYLRTLALTENDNISKYAKESLLIANRNIHQTRTITPLIHNLNTVVTDRSFLSGMVYARLQTYTFEKFFELSKLANILTYPDVIIYVKNKERRIVKNEGDIYDNADEETLDRVDELFEEAIEFIGEYLHTKNIKVFRFENDFTKSVNKNCDYLLKQLKKENINEG